MRSEVVSIAPFVDARLRMRTVRVCGDSTRAENSQLPVLCFLLARFFRSLCNFASSCANLFVAATGVESKGTRGNHDGKLSELQNRGTGLETRARQQVKHTAA